MSDSEPYPAPEGQPVPGDERIEPGFLQGHYEPLGPRDDIFWGWHDVALFLFITLMALGGAMGAAIGIRRLFHVSELRMNLVFVVAQFSAYGIAFGCLKLMFGAEYGQPLLRSLRWRRPPIASSTLAWLGLGQAFMIALIGAFMRIPQTENPMQRLMSDRPTAVLLAVLGVTAAPMAEELAFRGLLQPLLVRAIGVVPGILGTAVLFGGLHFEQYGSWQSVLLVSLAGAGFGAMRQWSGSTLASAIMHAGYNSALFILFFTQKGSSH